MEKNICTIIAKNYVAFARTLCASFLEQHPDGKCYVLIIDEFDGYVDPAQEKFEIIRPKELGIARLEEFCYKYNITELATAFKPYLLEYLMESRQLDGLLYLDPDILVTNSLHALFEELKTADIILTPHLDKDYPDDGLIPDDSHIMRSGIYNLGFIGVRKCENVHNFLGWWQRKLYDKCVMEHRVGYFVDQKFLDLAMVLFPNIRVIYDTGYNAAYWNIHSRNIHRKNEMWMCNDGPLHFYHFSDFKPERPDVLSGHQNRFNLNELPNLRALFLLYVQLLRSNGYEVVRNWPYTYKYYTNGRVIKEVERVAYRRLLPKCAVKNPFDLADYSWSQRFALAKRIVQLRLAALLRRFGGN